MCVCVCVCVCVYIYIYIYIRTHACKNVRVYPFILARIYMASFPKKNWIFMNIAVRNSDPAETWNGFENTRIPVQCVFWPVDVLNGSLGVSHYCSDSVLFGLASSLGHRKYSWPCHIEVQSKWTPTPRPRHFATPSTNVSQLHCILGPKTKQWTVPSTRAIHLLWPSMLLSLYVKLNECFGPNVPIYESSVIQVAVQKFKNQDI